MNSIQLHIDYTKVLHTHENNPESEAHLKSNRYHFTGQCAVLYSLLQKGMSVTTGQALRQLNIGDLRARIRDLRKAGIPIEDKWWTDASGKKTRYKEYFISTNISNDQS